MKNTNYMALHSAIVALFIEETVTNATMISQSSSYRIQCEATQCSTKKLGVHLHDYTQYTIYIETYHNLKICLPIKQKELKKEVTLLS